MANSIFLIHPYRIGPKSWVFDDKDRELKAEPFVAGIPEMIDFFTKDIPKAAKGFTLLFSATPIPDAQAHLTFVEKQGQGTFYKLKGTEMIGWLCPALYKYFDKPPKNIFCKFESLHK